MGNGWGRKEESSLPNDQTQRNKMEVRDLTVLKNKETSCYIFNPIAILLFTSDKKIVLMLHIAKDYTVISILVI